MACSGGCSALGCRQFTFCHACTALRLICLQSLENGLHRRHPLQHGLVHRRLGECRPRTSSAHDALWADWNFYRRHGAVCLPQPHGAAPSRAPFSCHAVFSTILGYLLFSETLSTMEFIGSSLVFSGVVLAIFFGRRGNRQHSLETIKGSVWIGVGLGLTAALCQALGGIIAKPVMQTAIDPVAASAIRMISAFIAHSALRFSGAKIARPTQNMTWQIFYITAINGFLAMAIGMTLILYALREGNVGMVALLSSTTPIMLLPILWIYTKQRPNRYAWLGAIIAVTGTGILVQ